MKNEKLFEKRTVDIKGADEDQWIWQKIDQGAWAGPLHDWNDNHFENYMRWVKEKRVVITAGGNMGLHTRAYASIFDTVYSFEPDWLNFHALVRNTLRENVHCFRAALTSDGKPCTIEKTTSLNNTGMHRIKPDIGSCPSIKIDNLQLDIVDFIQLDVEGYEEDVLKGAVETIQRTRPVIAIESDRASKFIIDQGYDLVETSGPDRVFKPK